LTSTADGFIELGLSDQVPAAPIERRGEHDEVNRGEEFVETASRQQAIERFAGDEHRTAFGRPDFHPERSSGGCELASDGAVPNDAESLAAQHRHLEGASIDPSAIALPFEPGGESASEHDHRRERVLGHRRRVRARRVREQDVAFRHALERMVLDAGRDAVDPPDLRSLDQSLEKRGIHPGHEHVDRVRRTFEEGGFVVGDELGSILGRRLHLRSVSVQEEAGQDDGDGVLGAHVVSGA
jgi:hypothetical protein